MYSVLPSFILGFHGCDEEVAEGVLSGRKKLRFSRNDYDWLGSGVYFWENNPVRAIEYARLMKAHPERCREKVNTPAVLGAVIDPGHCLNLLDSKNLQLIKESYHTLKAAMAADGLPLPENKRVGQSGDLLLRRLDCAVIELTHVLQKELVEAGNAQYEFDTVRAVFTEGEKLYENAGFSNKNHIQVCVRNPNCIKGYFRPVAPDNSFRIP